MSKGLLFFCCSCAILLFTIVNLSIGPIISGKVGNDQDPDGYDFNWGTMNCKLYNDIYDESKKTLSGDDLKYGAEWIKKECQLRKECMIWNTHPSFLILLLDLSVAY